MSWFPLSVSPRYCSLGTLKFQWIQEAPGAVSCIFPNVLAPWLPVRAPMLPSECVRTLSSLPVTPALASPAHTARISCRSPHQSVGASALPVSCRHRLVRLAGVPWPARSLAFGCCFEREGKVTPSVFAGHTCAASCVGQRLIRMFGSWPLRSFG